MLYRTNDGMTFSSFTSMCDHMISVNSDPEVKEYFRRERRKWREGKGVPVVESAYSAF